MAVNPLLRPGLLATITAGVLWGTTGTTQALAPAAAEPQSVGALRMVLGTATMAAIVLIGGESRAIPRELPALRRSAGWLVLGGLAVAAYQLCFFVAVARTGVAVGTMVALGSAPVLTGLFGWALGERPTRSWIVATAVAIVGIVLIVLGSGRGASVDVGGVLLALGAAAGYALYTVLGRRLLVAGVHGQLMMTLFFAVATVVLLPRLVGADLGWLVSPRGAISMLWLGVAATGVAYLLFQRGLAHLPAGLASTLSLAEPFTATLLGVLVLHEHLGLLSAVGVLVVLVGLVLAGAGARHDDPPPG